LVTHKNILIIQTAFIGDAILASSVVEKMHQFFPQAKISILVRKGNESLYQEHPFLTQTLVWNKQDGKYKNLFQLLKTIRKQKLLDYETTIQKHKLKEEGITFQNVSVDDNPKLGDALEHEYSTEYYPIVQIINTRTKTPFYTFVSESQLKGFKIVNWDTIPELIILSVISMT
jgi:hypothetical protein